MAKVRDKEATRARIVKAALKEFVEKGYEGTTISRIARRARLSKQLLSHHFPTKERLFQEVHDLRFRDIVVEIPPSNAADLFAQRFRLRAQDVDCILVASCTGYLCPDLATILVKEMALQPSVQRGALVGHGCAGALPALQRAYDHACAYPAHRVLAIAVEICSAAYFIDDTLETVVGNAICADGAAACLLSLAAETGPRLTGFASVLDTNCQSSVGFEQRQGKLRIILAPTIRDLAPPMIERALEALLTPRALTRNDVRFWLMHPGGRKVIDKVQEALGLSEEDIACSRSVYRNFGNMSSATVLFVLNELLQRGTAQPGDRGVMLALGPGFAAEAALLEW